MAELRPFIRQVHQVYGAIASKIEELIVSLNETEPDSKHVQELCRHINAFLGRLEQSVKMEWRSARSLPAKKKRQFLELLQRELDNIKQLEAYIALASRKPRPEIIRKIHALYKEVEEEMEEQEALAA